MEMSRQINATTQEVYEVVLEALYTEVTQSSNKKIHKSALKKGFTHTKKIKKGKTTTEYHYNFKELGPTTGYDLHVKTNSGTIYMGMKWQDEGDGTCMLTYHEDYKADYELKGVFYKISDFFYQRKIKRRARNMLKSIDDYIKKQRKEQAEAKPEKE